MSTECWVLFRDGVPYAVSPLMPPDYDNTGWTRMVPQESPAQSSKVLTAVCSDGEHDYFTACTTCGALPAQSEPVAWMGDKAIAALKLGYNGIVWPTEESCLEHAAAGGKGKPTPFYIHPPAQSAASSQRGESK